MTMYTKGALDMAVEKAVEAERKRCVEIALSIDSGRGNEKMIAQAIEMGATMDPVEPTVKQPVQLDPEPLTDERLTEIAAKLRPGTKSE